MPKMNHRLESVSSSLINVISEHNPGSDFNSLINVFAVANQLYITVIFKRQGCNSSCVVKGLEKYAQLEFKSPTLYINQTLMKLTRDQPDKSESSLKKKRKRNIQIHFSIRKKEECNSCQNFMSYRFPSIKRQKKIHSIFIFQKETKLSKGNEKKNDIPYNTAVSNTHALNVKSSTETLQLFCFVSSLPLPSATVWLLENLHFQLQPRLDPYVFRKEKL